MVTESWKREVIHQPQIGVPIATDGQVRVALIIDNPSTMPAFGLVWQQVDTALPEEWSWVGPRYLWQCSTQFDSTYTHADGTTVVGKFEDALAEYGDRMVFDWIPKMNELLRQFFGADAPEELTGIDVLYGAMKKLDFKDGQVVRVS